MAYMCVLRPSHECDGCEECEEERKDKQNWLWEKQEEEYDYYRDEEYISYLERSEEN